MNFNPSAFINPTSKADYIKLLDEALRMVDDLGEQWDQIFDEIKGEEKMTTETVLTDAEIITIGQQARAIETGENGYILPVTFARAIEQAVEQAVLQSERVQAWKRDSERLDAMAQRRMLVSPEYEGGWHAEIYDDQETPTTTAYNKCPRMAIDSAMERQK